MKKSEMILELKRLKEDKKTVILAHYYQEGDVQDIAILLTIVYS